MKRIFLMLVVCLNAHLAWSFTIATGPNEGSYFQIAQDIKKVSEKEGVELQVLPTKGSFENIQLLGTGKVDLAVAQLDALRYVSDVVRQQHGLNLFDKIKVVLCLYPEEIHVITNRKDIESFYQLEGKRVSVGTEGGGSALSAAVLFAAYDIKLVVSFETFDEAIKKLGQGGLDAVIFVGGAPVPFIQKLDNRFHLVRLPANVALEQLYLRAQVGNAQYAWASAPTETYAVPSAILGLDSSNEQYVTQAQRLVLSILNNQDSLQANGHPKWKSSIIQMYFPNRGYQPTNEIIQIFNILDRHGFKIVKK